MKIKIKTKLALSLILSISPYIIAGEVKITKDISSITINEDGKKIEIKRVQDQKHTIHSNFTKTSRECPPFCIQPMYINHVETIGELELLENIKKMQEEDSHILLLDVRTRNWFKEGTIPSATNLPFTMLDKNSKYINKVLKLLGAIKKNDKWNFQAVPTMIIFSNGIWDAQASNAIHSLLSFGCPEDKILYYRGGMQSWNSVGLTVK